MPRQKNTRPTSIYWLIDIRPETIAAGWAQGLPFYCGKTVQSPSVRMHGHRFDAKRGSYRPNSKRLNECGEYVRIAVLEIVPPEGDWRAREQYWIERTRCLFPESATNVADGGCGVPGYIPTDRHLKKMSVAMKARWQSPEYRAKQAEGLKRKWDSAEYRAKMSVVMEGRKPSKECHEKANAVRRGKPLSASHRANMAAARTGRKLSPEHRAKVGAFHRGRPKSLEQKIKMSAAQKAAWAVRRGDVNV